MNGIIIKPTVNGVIALPEIMKQQVGLTQDDQFIVIFVPPDTLMLRKISHHAINNQQFRQAMQEFDQALHRAGYETNEDIIQLVREIKVEQAAEWLGESQGAPLI